MSIRPKSKLLAGVIIGVIAAASAAAVAQSAAPAPAAPQAAVPVPAATAPAVVAPVVPTAPAANPGALAAIEQSVATAPPAGAAPVAAPGQVVVAAPGAIVQPAGPAPYVVPPSGPGIFQGSEQTLREIAFLQTEVALNAKRKEHVDSVMALEAAKKDLSDQLSGKPKDGEKGAAGAAGGASPEGAVVVVPVKPEPYVNSVYGYGNEMYAEIVLGQTKVLATKGTVLTDGSRVVSVSNSGVTLSSKGRTKKLAIRGAAGF